MDVQMIIPVRAADTPFTGRAVPVVISHTNISPISCAAIREHDLMNDLKPFAAHHKLRLEGTHSTTYLLHLLLTYQATSKIREPAATRIRNTIHLLETTWKADIKDWSKREDFTFEDANTGKIVWNTYFDQFITLILQPLQTRSAYVFLDEKGDISGKVDGPGVWRRLTFTSYSLNPNAKTFGLHFYANRQQKGLILDINDIQEFDIFGIYFQHPTHPDCVLFNPFSCDEFAQPRYDSIQFKRRIMSELFEHTVSTTRERIPDSTEDQTIAESPQETTGTKPADTSPETIFDTSE